MTKEMYGAPRPIHYIAIMAKHGKLITARLVELTSVPSPLMIKGTSGVGLTRTECLDSTAVRGKPILRMISKASTSKLLWPPTTTAISGSRPVKVWFVSMVKIGK